MLALTLKGLKKIESYECVSKFLDKIDIGNLLIALSTTGLFLIGTLSLPISITVLAVNAILLVFVGVIGRYIDQIKDDRERLKAYETYLRENSDRNSCYYSVDNGVEAFVINKHSESTDASDI